MQDILVLFIHNFPISYYIYVKTIYQGVDRLIKNTNYISTKTQHQKINGNFIIFPHLRHTCFSLICRTLQRELYYLFTFTILSFYFISHMYFDIMHGTPYYIFKNYLFKNILLTSLKSEERIECLEC
jgi:hypothetical protein